MYVCMMGHLSRAMERKHDTAETTTSTSTQGKSKTVFFGSQKTSTQQTPTRSESDRWRLVFSYRVVYGRSVPYAGVRRATAFANTRWCARNLNPNNQYNIVRAFPLRGTYVYILVVLFILPATAVAKKNTLKISLFGLNI